MKDKLLFEQRKNSIRDMIYDPDYIPLKLLENLQAKANGYYEE